MDTAEIGGDMYHAATDVGQPLTSQGTVPEDTRSSILHRIGLSYPSDNREHQTTLQPLKRHRMHVESPPSSASSPDSFVRALRREDFPKTNRGHGATHANRGHGAPSRDAVDSPARANELTRINAPTPRHENICSPTTVTPLQAEPSTDRPLGRDAGTQNHEGGSDDPIGLEDDGGEGGSYAPPDSNSDNDGMRNEEGRIAPREDDVPSPISSESWLRDPEIHAFLHGTGTTAETTLPLASRTRNGSIQEPVTRNRGVENTGGNHGLLGSRHHTPARRDPTGRPSSSRPDPTITTSLTPGFVSIDGDRHTTPRSRKTVERERRQSSLNEGGLDADGGVREEVWYSPLAPCVHRGLQSTPEASNNNSRENPARISHSRHLAQLEAGFQQYFEMDHGAPGVHPHQARRDGGSSQQYVAGVQGLRQRYRPPHASLLARRSISVEERSTNALPHAPPLGGNQRGRSIDNHRSLNLQQHSDRHSHNLPPLTALEEHASSGSAPPNASRLAHPPLLLQESAEDIQPPLGAHRPVFSPRVQQPGATGHFSPRVFQAGHGSDRSPDRRRSISARPIAAPVASQAENRSGDDAPRARRSIRIERPIITRTTLQVGDRSEESDDVHHGPIIGPHSEAPDNTLFFGGHFASQAAYRRDESPRVRRSIGAEGGSNQDSLQLGDRDDQLLRRAIPSSPSFESPESEVENEVEEIPRVHRSIDVESADSNRVLRAGNKPLEFPRARRSIGAEGGGNQDPLQVGRRNGQLLRHAMPSAPFFESPGSEVENEFGEAPRTRRSIGAEGGGNQDPLQVGNRNDQLLRHAMPSAPFFESPEPEVGNEIGEVPHARRSIGAEGGGNQDALQLGDRKGQFLRRAMPSAPIFESPEPEVGNEIGEVPRARRSIGVERANSNHLLRAGNRPVASPRAHRSIGFESANAMHHALQAEDSRDAPPLGRHPAFFNPSGQSRVTAPYFNPLDLESEHLCLESGRVDSSAAIQHNAHPHDLQEDDTNHESPPARHSMYSPRQLVPGTISFPSPRALLVGHRPEEAPRALRSISVERSELSVPLSAVSESNVSEGHDLSLDGDVSTDSLLRLSNPAPTGLEVEDGESMQRPPNQPSEAGSMISAWRPSGRLRVRANGATSNNGSSSSDPLVGVMGGSQTRGETSSNNRSPESIPESFRTPDSPGSGGPDDDQRNSVPFPRRGVSFGQFEAQRRRRRRSSRIREGSGGQHREHSPTDGSLFPTPEFGIMMHASPSGNGRGGVGGEEASDEPLESGEAAVPSSRVSFANELAPPARGLRPERGSENAPTRAGGRRVDHRELNDPRAQERDIRVGPNTASGLGDDENIRIAWNDAAAVEELSRTRREALGVLNAGDEPQRERGRRGDGSSRHGRGAEFTNESSRERALGRPRSSDAGERGHDEPRMSARGRKYFAEVYPTSMVAAGQYRDDRGSFNRNRRASEGSYRVREESDVYTGHERSRSHDRSSRRSHILALEARPSTPHSPGPEIAEGQVIEEMRSPKEPPNFLLATGAGQPHDESYIYTRRRSRGESETSRDLNTAQFEDGFRASRALMSEGPPNPSQAGLVGQASGAAPTFLDQGRTREFGTQAGTVQGNEHEVGEGAQNRADLDTRLDLYGLVSSPTRRSTSPPRRPAEMVARNSGVSEHGRTPGDEAAVTPSNSDLSRVNRYHESRANVEDEVSKPSSQVSEEMPSEQQNSSCGEERGSSASKTVPGMNEDELEEYGEREIDLQDFGGDGMGDGAGVDEDESGVGYNYEEEIGGNLTHLRYVVTQEAGTDAMGNNAILSLVNTDVQTENARPRKRKIKKKQLPLRYFQAPQGEYSINLPDIDWWNGEKPRYVNVTDPETRRQYRVLKGCHLRSPEGSRFEVCNGMLKFIKAAPARSSRRKRSRAEGLPGQEQYILLGDSAPASQESIRLQPGYQFDEVVQPQFD